MLKEYLEIKLLFFKEKIKSSYHHSKNAGYTVQEENLMENIERRFEQRSHSCQNSSLKLTKHGQSNH